MAASGHRPALLHRSAGGRGRSLVAVGAGTAALAAVLARLHATRGYDVLPLLPVPLCPFHAATGLWCPVCGSLRAVASLTRLDVAGALSSNLLVTALLPLLALAVLSPAVTSVTGRRVPAPTLDNRAWVVLGVAFSVFTVWRNLPGLPLSGWLAP